MEQTRFGVQFSFLFGRFGHSMFNFWRRISLVQGFKFQDNKQQKLGIYFDQWLPIFFLFWRLVHYIQADPPSNHWYFLILWCIFLGGGNTVLRVSWERLLLVLYYLRDTDRAIRGFHKLWFAAGIQYYTYVRTYMLWTNRKKWYS